MIITVALLAVLVGLVGFGVALTMRSRQEFADANEVVPGVKSTAPASWAGAHSPEAKLHRRLRQAVLAARANPNLVEHGLAAKTKKIETEALAIDDRLVAAAALFGEQRVEAVAAFEAPVAALEAAVATLVQSTTISDSKELLEQTVSDADVRLQALAEARAEVEALDRVVTDPGKSGDTGDTDETDEPGDAQAATA